MDITDDLAACLRADRLREAEYERLVGAVKQAGRSHAASHRVREVIGLGLIRTGLRLVGPVTP